jgi:hypothetical protein
LLIERDPGGEWSADAMWRVAKTEGRLVIGNLEWCKRSSECKNSSCLDWCSPGNGRLDIIVGPESIRFGVHYYQLQVGNVFREEGVDLSEFRAIISSFREVPSTP